MGVSQYLGARHTKLQKVCERWDQRVSVFVQKERNAWIVFFFKIYNVYERFIQKTK